MIRILGRADSFNVRKVLWTCGELGLAFEREDWGRGFRPTTDPKFRAINPIGLVPAVIDGDVALRESNAIVRYLVGKYAPGHPMYPADLIPRACLPRGGNGVPGRRAPSRRGTSAAR